MHEETLSRKLLYSGNILDLHIEEVRLSNGVESTRELITVADAAGAVALLDNETVLLIRQYRKAVEQVLLEIPAGKIDPGEEPLPAMQRELREETGYEAAHWERLCGYYSAPGFSAEMIHLYLAQELTLKDTQPDEDEMIELAPTPIVELSAMIADGRICDGKTVAALSYFMRNMRR